MKITVINPAQRLESSSAMESLKLSHFDEGGAGAFWSEAVGTSPWEMHPDRDEFLHILEGEIEIEILPMGTGDSSVAKVPAGSFVVVPKGYWHRQTILARTKELYVTPGQTMHCTEKDPR